MRFSDIESILDKLEAVSLQYFRAKNLDSQSKSETDFDPVTVADKKIEALFREWVQERFPEYGVMGEEFEISHGLSEMNWVIDPIDGTRAFVMGIPSFTILIALRENERPINGVISQPFTGERFWGLDEGAFWQRGETRQTLKTSSISSLRQAKTASTFPEVGTPAERASFERLASNTLLTRFGLDAYAYGLLAMGQIDLIAEAGLKPFDYCAPQAVIEAAGGVVTDWEGNPPRGLSTVLASANPHLHEKALQLLKAS